MTAHGQDRSASPDGAVRAAKDQVRARILAARRALPAQERAARAEAIAAHAVALADGVSGPVCSYLPFGTEPGSPALVEGLVAAGHDVLLPVVPDGAGPMDWAPWTSDADTAPTRIGIREPTGRRLGPGAIAQAALVLLPALAVDRAGTRLGRGRGHYDRSLPLAAPGALLVAVVDDDELVAALPAEPHDRRVAAALLPRAGVTWLRNRN
ncbi:5-formyltetrahydrofolate cyclo-ligase [Pseudonocardia sp. CA-107938]|uniref:5-formyltetrahydrofolate cyclo-ligase n=1 Tax=Pseudonocardia sp. CA-107938 TaxID=3240021 RepID=UPI003D8D72FC